jgi:hypothetical protein
MILGPMVHSHPRVAKNGRCVVSLEVIYVKTNSASVKHHVLLQY